MSEDSQAHFDEKTLVAIRERLPKSRWGKYHARAGEHAVADRLELKRGDRLIPRGSVVDHLYMLRAGSIQMIPGPSQTHVPLMPVFHANPTGTSRDPRAKAAPSCDAKAKKVRDLPILGARYFFVRRPSSYDYVAQTDAVVYAIPSALIVAIGANAENRGDQDMLLLMRETLINSDIAELVIHDLLLQLAIIHDPIRTDFDLLKAAEEVRAYPIGQMLIDAVSSLFEERIAQRIESANVQDLESSIVVDQL